MVDQAVTTLAHLQAARDAMLARVTEVLTRDARVNAAWLSGSFGRGEVDAWSDLDLHVAVADEHYDAYWQAAAALFAQVGTPILAFGGMLSNSMPGGRFWLVQYVPCMLEIDWNIGPTHDTTRPAAAHVIVDRVGIPVTPLPQAAADETRRDVAQRQLDFFWAMAPLAVKFVGRGHTRLAVKQTDYLRDAFTTVWRALWHPEVLERESYHQNRPLEAELDARLPRFDINIDPQAALAVIRAYCREMERLHPALATLGVEVNAEVVRQTLALAQIAEHEAQAGGSGPQRGSRR